MKLVFHAATKGKRYEIRIYTTTTGGVFYYGYTKGKCQSGKVGIPTIGEAVLEAKREIEGARLIDEINYKILVEPEVN